MIVTAGAAGATIVLTAQEVKNFRTILNRSVGCPNPLVADLAGKLYFNLYPPTKEKPTKYRQITLEEGIQRELNEKNDDSKQRS